jgi:predicted histidine transporter YuiF (NhaC family)
MPASFLAWLWAILKSVTKFASILASLKKFLGFFQAMITKYHQDKIKKQREGMEQAIEDLKKAETKEEIDAAAEKIGKNI